KLTFFFPSFSFMDSASSPTYTLSLHDALPISRQCYRLSVEPRSSHRGRNSGKVYPAANRAEAWCSSFSGDPGQSFVQHLKALSRSEEHTSELQSRSDLVCRLLLEKKKTNVIHT